MKIAVAVVTYNRLEFLKDLIASLKGQSRKPDHIIITNNSSTDGTEEWLKEQDGIKFVTQENVGSSGGQYRSIQECQKTDAEYFWIMDDDVQPNKECLENLEKELKKNRVLTPLRKSNDGSIFYNEVIEFNLSWPFKSIWNGIINKSYLDNFDNLVPAEGLTFEGPIFHRSLIDEIGYPEFNFFIHADDSEFMIRAKKAGFELNICKSAILNRRLPAPDPRDEFTWKHYYIIRNLIAIDVLHGSSWVKKLRPYFYYYRWMKRATTKEEKETVKKALKDGLKYKEKFQK